MNRSPLFYPLNRGADGEAGGAADLQTDVMRFMAILSLCLVAIFALVHSIPPTEIPREEAVAEPEPVEIEMPVEKPIVVAEIVPAPPPEPEKSPVMEAQEINLQYPALPKPSRKRAPPPPQPIPNPVPTKAVVAEMPPPVAEPAPPQDGFSLRFEDDLALTRLVARNEIGMYALNGDKAMRMNVNRGDIGFWAASKPKQFHEMESATVPDPVIDAYRYRADAAAVKWGVTLPPRMTQQLNEYLNSYPGGAIIIEANGEMRLDR